jgi:hypothetical protein
MLRLKLMAMRWWEWVGVPEAAGQVFRVTPPPDIELGGQNSTQLLI